MKPRTDKAFAFAQDVTKQLITLATGVLAITITFRKDVLAGAPGTDTTWLAFAWVAFLVSIAFGVWALMAMTGTLGTQRPDDGQEPSIYETGIVVPSIAQVVLFLAGLGLTLTFGIAAL